MRFSLFDAWFPMAVAVVTLLGVYLRHRKKPVGLFGWSLPVVVGLLAALVPGFLELTGFDLERATPENRHRIGGGILENSLGHVLAGLYAAVASGVVGVFLLPRKDDAASIPWKSLIGVVVLAFAGLVAAYTVGSQWLSGTAFAFVNGFFVIVVLTHIALMRLSNSDLTSERAILGGGLATVSVLGWGLAMITLVSVLRWGNLEMATVENMMRTAYHHLQLGGSWPWVVGPAFAVFGISLVQYVVRVRGKLRPGRDGFGRRAMLAFVAALVVGIVAGGFTLQYRDAAAQTEHAHEVFQRPLAFVDDFNAPTSSSRLSALETPLIKVGAASTIVSKGLRTEGAVALELDDPVESATDPLIVEGSDELNAGLDAVVAAKKRESELLGMPFDNLVTVAADRCMRFEEVLYALRAAQKSELNLVKLAVEDEGGKSRVINVRTAYDEKLNDLEFDYDILVDRGITVTAPDGFLPAVEGCSEGGATLCLPEAASDDCSTDYDWSKLRRVLVDRGGDNRQYVVTVSPEVRWQTVIDLMDELRWKDPSAESNGDNELLTDPVIFLGLVAP